MMMGVDIIFPQELLRSPGKNPKILDIFAPWKYPVVQGHPIQSHHGTCVDVSWNALCIRHGPEIPEPLAPRSCA